MITWTTPPAILFLFATDAALDRMGMQHPQLSYTATSLAFITPLFVNALYTRLTDRPDHLMEVEAIVTCLTVTVVYIAYFSFTVVPKPLRILYGVVIFHLLLTPPEETLLHRMLFISSFCQHAQHMTSIGHDWSGSFDHLGMLARKIVTVVSYVAIGLSIAVDIISGHPGWYHFALLAALPHAVPLDMNDFKRGEERLNPIPMLMKAPVTNRYLTNEGMPCDESGLLVSI